METINQITGVLIGIIIPAGVLFRVIFCLTKMIWAEEENASYKKKIINTIAFGIIAELVTTITSLLISYYR